jgi:DNA-binding transcriptional ArsR family regulator
MERLGTMGTTTGPHGWRVERSIAIELDVAAFYIRLGADALPKTMSDLAISIPDGWFSEYDELSSAAGDTHLVSIVEPMARWAGVLFEEDYDTASAAIREISAVDAIKQVAESSGLEPRDDLDAADALIDLDLRVAAELFAPFGKSEGGTAPPGYDRAITAAARTLRGEPMHGRFWHWIDRFYYEAYGPWRVGQMDVLAEGDDSVITHLGALRGNTPPVLDWLPESNSLISRPALGEAVSAGDLEVVFWSEPFGLSDTWALAPGIVMTSFAKQGHLYEHYKGVRSDLATRLKALADPTRLSVLRMIRMHDLDNTQIAECLGLSRPTVSIHAKALAEAGLITTTRDGRQAVHSCEPDAIRNLFSELATFLDDAVDITKT